MEDESALLDNLLDIILKSYMQREHFINSLVELVVLSSQIDIDMYYKIRAITEKLRTSVDTLYYFLITESDGGGKLPLDEILENKEFWNSQLMESEFSSPDVKQSKQRIMMILNCHEPMVKLYYHLIRHLKEKGIDKRELAEYQSVLKFCIEFLCYFCDGMAQNQLVVFKSFSTIVENVTSEDYFIDMIIAIYSGNRTLCENHSKEIIDLFIKLVEIYGRRAKFLELLICLISCVTPKRERSGLQKCVVSCLAICIHFACIVDG